MGSAVSQNSISDNDTKVLPVISGSPLSTLYDCLSKFNNNNQLIEKIEALVRENLDYGEEIHSKNQLINELSNNIISLQNENYFLINKLNYFMNDNNALRNYMNQMTQFYHPDNMYPQQIQVEKQVEETKLLSFTTFDGKYITDLEITAKIFEFINQNINVDSKECEVDSNKINYIGGNQMMSLFNMIFPNQKSIKALNVAKKGLLNQEIEEKEYQRQITLATLVFSNGETLIISASAVSRAYLYVHFNHMIKICGKCTCCWIWDEKLQEYQYWDGNCQSEIDFYTLKNKDVLVSINLNILKSQKQ